jgi:D-amino-acid dehydrogenase
VDRHVALAREVGVPELIVQRGHLHLYPDAQAFDKDRAAWQLREMHGYRAERLDRDAILALEPAIPPRYRFAAWLADHATVINPFRYVTAIAASFVRHGGRLLQPAVQALAPQGRQWRLRTGAGDLSFTQVVVATGAWSRRLLDPLGVHVHLESQRGYHLQFHGASPVSRTVVLADRKVFCTPMEDGLRVGGTVEIGGLDAPPDPRRTAILARIAHETFGTALDESGMTTWMGHRPCMPDSLPLIGPAPDRQGLWLALGHGHLGLTDSPATAERIAGAITVSFRETGPAAAVTGGHR